MTLPAATVIMACHNRLQMTVRAILSALASAKRAGVAVSFIVLDDGSTDGTETALRDILADITVIRGDGSFFWAKSMQRAEEAALRRIESPDDVIIWLNDDVDLDIDAVGRAMQQVQKYPGAVIAGAVRDPRSGELTYSGMKRRGPHPLTFEATTPDPFVAVPVDTFNGNFVLVPAGTATEIGGIDGYYSHSLADIDYGLRARNLSIMVLLAPGTYGTCARNIPQRGGSPLQDWKRFVGIKGGGNFPSLVRFIRKSHPVTFIIPIAWSYGAWWARRLSKRAGK